MSSVDQACVFPVREITRGFAEAGALDQRYQQEGFKLDSGFEKPEWAEQRAAQLQREYRLQEEDIRIVQHISTPETGCRSTWLVYARDVKGIGVLFG
jgi:hypothetical protein